MQYPARTRASLAVVALTFVTLTPALAGPPRTQKAHDPFENKQAVEKAKQARVKPAEPVTEVAPPALEARLEKCRPGVPSGERVEQMPCVYLVRELTLTGVFGSGSDARAFLATKPNDQTIIVRAGDKLFDGEVVSIRDAGPNGPAQVVLRQTAQRRIRSAVKAVTTTVTLNLDAPRL